MILVLGRYYENVEDLNSIDRTRSVVVLNRLSFLHNSKVNVYKIEKRPDKLKLLQLHNQRSLNL